jgi:RNA polymerase sigma factor (sigma-70 family)
MTDQNIINLFLQRLEDSIRYTAEKYGRYLMKISFNILNQFEEAEECVSDTYLAAWNQIPPERPEKLLPYLGRITRCLSLNRYDYLTAQKRNSDFNLQLSEIEECLSTTDSVESHYEAGAIASAISAFLREIDTDARNIFIRRYWFSDPIRDIATRFDMSESKVKSNLFRTRNRLKIYLETEGYNI